MLQHGSAKTRGWHDQAGRSMHAAVCVILIFATLLFCLSFHYSVDSAYAASSKLTAIEVYAATTNAYGDWLEMLSRTKNSDGSYTLKDGIKEKGGQIRICLEASWSDGIAYYQYNESWRDLSITYKTSNSKIATVSSNGIVTGTGDGTVTITVTATDTANDVTKSGSLTIVVAGQSGPYVTEVYVCDEKGKQYEESRLTYEDTDFDLVLYFREVFSDGSKASNAPKASDYDLSALTEYAWSVSDSSVASIGTTSGVVSPKTLGQFKATVTVTGGDPEVKQGNVSSYVWVVIDNGEYSTTGDYPSDSLTVNVVYDDYPDYVVATDYYTIDDLKKIETVRSTYTLTCTNGDYVTASAEGIYLMTLIDRIGVDTHQIKSFTFTALDGVNPGKMSYDFLFRESYYFPHYEINGSTVDAVLVFPMLAWASDWRQSSSGATNCGEDYDALNTNTRLRLLFGATSNSDDRLDRSLKYISEMTIRIEGAPPSSDGPGDDGSGNGGSGGGDGSGNSPGDDPSGGDGGSGGASDGTGNGSGQGNGTGAGTAEGDAGAETDAGQAASGAADGNADATAVTTTQIAAAAEGAETSTQLPIANTRRPTTRDVAAAIKAKSAAGGSGGGSAGSSQRWHAYQMMNPDDDTAFQIDELANNPFMRWVLWLALALLFIGGFYEWLKFRRRLKA